MVVTVDERLDLLERSAARLLANAAAGSLVNHITHRAARWHAASWTLLQTTEHVGNVTRKLIRAFMRWRQRALGLARSRLRIFMAATPGAQCELKINPTRF